MPPPKFSNTTVRNGLADHSRRILRGRNRQVNGGHGFWRCLARITVEISRQLVLIDRLPTPQPVRTERAALTGRYRVGGGFHGEVVSGLAPCLEPTAQGARIHHHGGHYTGSGHRRQHGHLHAGAGHPFALAAGGRSRTALPHRRHRRLLRTGRVSRRRRKHRRFLHLLLRPFSAPQELRAGV